MAVYTMHDFQIVLKLRIIFYILRFCKFRSAVSTIHAATLTIHAFNNLEFNDSFRVQRRGVNITRNLCNFCLK